MPAEAPSVGKKVSALDLPAESMLPLIMHPDGRPEVPTGETLIQGGAVVLAVTLPVHETELRRAFTGAD